MEFRSHELPQNSKKDPKQLINKAMSEGHLVYITYRDRDGNETKRKFEPLEWVEDYKIRAYCHLAQAERHFVLSGIKEISLIVNSGESAKFSAGSSVQSTTKNVVSRLEQWKSAEPVSSTTSVETTTHKSPEFNFDRLFSQVSNSDQWQQLIRYYAECLNREYLQNYLIDQQGDYRFFPADEDVVLKFLAGQSSFTFARSIERQPTEVSEFITNSTKRDQQLCIGHAVLLTPEGKIAPLFFSPCDVQIQDDKILLHPDEYELSYAIVQVLDLDNEEFANIVADLTQNEFGEISDKIRALREAVLLKLEELTRSVIPRREANNPKLVDTVPQMTLYTTPCLFWASKNNITHTLIQELEEIGKRPWEAVPKSLINLLNTAPSSNYPSIVPFGRDNEVYATRINDEQRRAVQAASELPITVVTGPPGTGKSQLVVNIIANAVMNDKSVLFASRNNRAVDVVVGRLKNEMKFLGIVRTGNRNVRKDAANAMTDALARAARSQTRPNIPILMDNYRKNKNVLATQLEALHEIQRLKKSRAKKLGEFESICEELPSDLANLLRSRKVEITLEELITAKKSSSSLIETFKGIQKRKEAIEAVIQKHTVDNQHNHPLVEDLEAFELEWGAFGDGLRKADYFTTLESTQSHIERWTKFVESVSKRLMIEIASKEVKALQQKLDAAIETLSPELQISIEKIALKASKEYLKSLNTQIQHIGILLKEAQRLSFANWFGLRRGAQINAISSSFNSLLLDLRQTTIDTPVKLSDLRTRFQMIQNYVSAIVSMRSLKVKENRLKQIRQNLTETLNVFSEQTREQFWRVNLQAIEPTDLQKLFGKLENEVRDLIAQRQIAVKQFYDSVERNKSLSEIWSKFQSIAGGEEYYDWAFDDEISLAILESFAVQWSSTLIAIETKAEIDQLTDILEKKGSEEEINQRVEEMQRKVTDKAIEILNSKWLQNVNNLRSDRVQRVRDYASLISEVAENYDNQKYSNMMSIQGSNTDDIISVFPIWATTNLSISRNLPLRAELFDVVIIDEASQCDIPSALPLIYRAKQVIVIGDAMQLRHIATLTEDSHQILAAEHNVATEAYSYTQHSLFDLAGRSVGQHPGIIMLREHYRSHEHIISFSNQTFYDSNLVIKTDMTNRGIPDEILKTACGIFWLNVSGETIHPSGGSAKNTSEINMIKQILPPLHQRIASSGWDGTLGVVTPYKEQKNEIQRWVDNQLGQQITVGTAHTFQGDEREVLIFSPVLASGISDGSLAWLKRTKNLLNVAVTRARTCLIIVGDFNFCMSLSEDNPYRQLAEYIRENPGAICRSWQELPFLYLE